MEYFVYIVECADTTLYTGITTDLERRLTEHNQSEKWAKYTRVRRPVMLVYSEKHASRSEACQREYTIKQLSREEKLEMMRKHWL